MRGVDWLLSKVLLVQHSMILTLPADTSLNYVLYYVDALSLFHVFSTSQFTKVFSIQYLLAFTPCEGDSHTAA